MQPLHRKRRFFPYAEFSVCNFARRSVGCRLNRTFSANRFALSFRRAAYGLLSFPDGFPNIRARQKTQNRAKLNLPLHMLCKGIFMPEKTTERSHSLNYCNNILSVCGVVSVLEISEREAQLKLSRATLCIKGSGLNVIKLDREQGTLQLETQSVSQMVYRQNGLGLKGIFK